jgi:hypothetical protein
MNYDDPHAFLISSVDNRVVSAVNEDGDVTSEGFVLQRGERLVCTDLKTAVNFPKFLSFTSNDQY